MRRLAQPQVMTAAGIAAVISALLSLPRMLLWEDHPQAIWYIEAVLVLCGFVLWAFVFGWHTPYTHRPLFRLKINSSVLAAATAAGIITGLVAHFWHDPLMRATVPKDFPPDVKHWIANVLFSLGFMQLFLLFAPFDWSVRLFQNEKAALWVTIALGIFVFWLRNDSLPTGLPPSLLIQQMVFKGVGIFFGVWFYLRGGIFLVCWINLLIEARHLLTFSGL